MAAAEALLRERPFRELTVDEVMRRTGLSRPSFYVYFKDRHELVLRVVSHLQAELLEVANEWYQSREGGVTALRTALEGVVEVYGRHGAVLRALADAAADDLEVEAVYGDLIRSFIQATSQHIAEEIEAGNVSDVDAAEIAKALVWMTERYLYHAFAPGAPASHGAVLKSLATVWSRALYG